MARISSTLKQLSALLVLLVGVGIGLVAVSTPQKTSTSARDHSTRPAIVGLTSPYLRLGNPREGRNPNEILVDVFIGTGGIETLAADVYIQYDPQTLSISPTSVISYKRYQVTTVNQASSGIIDVSFFSNPDRGEATVSTTGNQETELATLVFEKIASAESQTTLKLIHSPGNLSDSNIIEVFDTRPETPQDILKSVQDLNLTF